ncbi:MAG TPA: thiamine pyrophosphate-dependent dehydrogenase E1 component subunit alpha [Thermoplasmata archaeon]|nr:thiamine pyrophosphate-dependent dehydrogenase E1 component subunit alpha [Thermoplasmata archaeon]
MQVRCSYLQVSPEVESHSASREIADDRARAYLRTMLLCRALETGLTEAYGRVEFRGELHLSAGHEAVAAGVVDAAEPCFVVGTHRSHAVALSKGVDPTALAAEIYGRDSGVCHGKGGHMHLTALDRGFLTTGIVGATVPIAAGYALSARQLNLGRIGVAFLGDGAMNQGAVLETLNLAPAWKLPLLLVVENNELAFSTRTADLSSIRPLAARCRGFGMDAYVADGTDATVVWAIAAEIVHRIRAGGKPALIEFQVPRLSGHLEVVDFEEYLAEEEKRRRVAQDPLGRTEESLLRAGVLDRAGIEALTSEVKEEAERALEAARAAPFPDVTSATTDSE